MVLDNSSASAQADAFSESTPASDADPYSSQEEGSPGAQNYHIDIASLPKPMPIFGPLLGYNQKILEKLMAGRIAARGELINRPLTQDEAAGIAYWTAKQVSIFSYATPVGIAGGLWRANNTKDTFRFPFWQPNLDKFRSDIFPPKFPTLRGGPAVLAWHALRVAAYCYVGKSVGQLIIGSYSATVAGVGELSDPRLKEVSNATRQKAQQKRGALGPPQPVGGRQNGAIEVGSNKQQDDASPTGGTYGDENAALMSVGGDGVPQEDAWAKRGTTQISQAPLPPVEQETQERQFTDFDDSSPTGGRGVGADTTAETGSVWERIRKGANTSGGQTKTSWPTESQRQSGQSAWSKRRENSQEEQRSAKGESFSFSKTEEERNLAKSEAQKEFDARVERERRGGEFSGGGGDQRRW